MISPAFSSSFPGIIFVFGLDRGGRGLLFHCFSSKYFAASSALSLFGTCKPFFFRW